MPFPSPVGKLTLSGYHAGVETWSYSMHTLPLVMTAAIMDGIETAARAFHNINSTSGGAFLDQIKFAQLNTNGIYADDDQPFIRDLDPVEPGGGTSGGIVPQGTFVVSLETPLKRGLGHEGRFYCPPTGLVANSANGQIELGQQSVLADEAQAFIDALNSAMSVQVVVASSRGAGAIHVVTSVRVGRVMDTQRRRRRNILEEYVSRPITP